MAFNGFKKRAVSLNCFVRGIVQALCDGQQAIPESRESHLMEHMDKTEDGTLTPKTFTIDTGDKSLEVPTYSFAQVNTIGIHKATVKCSAKLVDISKAEKKAL